jgi:hypothetical protein
MHKANQQFKKGEIVTGLKNRPKGNSTPLQSFFSSLMASVKDTSMTVVIDCRVWEGYYYF